MYDKETTILESEKIGSCSKARVESEKLWDLAEEYVVPGGFVLEVGSWEGSSAYILAAVCANKGAHLVCIDTFSGDILHAGVPDDGSFFLNTIAQTLKGMPVSYLKMNSTIAHKILADNTFDMIFVDGDHTAPVVYADIVNYQSKVRRGGVYCGHDYTLPELPDGTKFSVKEAVDIFLGEVEVSTNIWFKKRL